MTPEQREFKALMTVLGWSAAKTAKQLGVSRSAVSQIVNGKNSPGGPTLGMLRRLALAEQEGAGLTLTERRQTPRHGEGPYWGMRKEVPIIGPVSAGAGFEAIDNEADYPHIASDTKDANAYAVYVEGDSMEPVYKAGDVLVVEPNSPPQPGQYAIAKTSDHDVYFKLFQRSGRNGEIIRLVSLNPLYPAMEFDGSGLIWCHRVRSVYRLLVQPNKD